MDNVKVNVTTSLGVLIVFLFESVKVNENDHADNIDDLADSLQLAVNEQMIDSVAVESGTESSFQVDCTVNDTVE